MLKQNVEEKPQDSNRYKLPADESQEYQVLMKDTEQVPEDIPDDNYDNYEENYEEEEEE